MLGLISAAVSGIKMISGATSSFREPTIAPTAVNTATDAQIQAAQAEATAYKAQQAAATSATSTSNNSMMMLGVLAALGVGAMLYFKH